MNDEDLDIPLPDPVWEYYPIWHSLNHVAAKINVALKILARSEDATTEIDFSIYQLLAPASNRLEEIVTELSQPYQPPDESQ